MGRRLKPAATSGLAATGLKDGSLRRVLQESRQEKNQDPQNQGGVLQGRAIELCFPGNLGEVFKVQEVDREENSKKKDFFLFELVY